MFEKEWFLNLVYEILFSEDKFLTQKCRGEAKATYYITAKQKNSNNLI